MKRHFFVSLLLFGLLFLSPALDIAQAESEQLSVVIHIHSNYSKGRWSIAEIAGFAKEKQIDVLVMTDSLVERYEYGLPPLRGVFKKTIERESVIKKGIQEYFKEIRSTNLKTPEVLVIDGVSATPFYHWTGSLWPGPLVLNGRAKDFLVFGLDSQDGQGLAGAYKSLPVLGLGNSGFSAYEGEQFSEPYQKFVDSVRDQGGLSFWSHPFATESETFAGAFGGMKVQLNTSNYEQEVFGVFDYTGIAVFPDELAVINLANRGLISVGGIWDRLLGEYCDLKRDHPVWVLGETDYTGIKSPKRQLGILLNQIMTQGRNRKAVLEAFRLGKFYLIMPGPEQTRRLRLEEFSVQNTLTGAKAHMGETLPKTEAPEIVMRWSYSDGAADPLSLKLVRNGKVLNTWTQGTPRTLRYTDLNFPQGKKSYYRLIGHTEQGDRLLTNPIFVDA